MTVAVCVSPCDVCDSMGCGKVRVSERETERQKGRERGSGQAEADDDRPSSSSSFFNSLGTHWFLVLSCLGLMF